MNHLTLALFFFILGSLPSNSRDLSEGRRQLTDYEADIYGPLPFPEEVHPFIDHELEYLLGRQKDDGSWESAQPMGNGRTTLEAGGTVGDILLTSMVGYSLRNYVDRDPARYEKAISRALVYVVAMVTNGKLHSNVMDSSWQYIYTFRFLLSEYPHIQDTHFRKKTEDAAAILIAGLKDCQCGTYGQRSLPFDWRRRSSPGMVVSDTEKGMAIVVACPEGSPAYQAEIRKGDQLLATRDTMIDTALRYALAEPGWRSGDEVIFTYLRDAEAREARVKLPRQYPGTLGVNFAEKDGALVVSSFSLLSHFKGSFQDDALQIGDLVQEVNGVKLSKIEDLAKANLIAGIAASVTVSRNTGRKKLQVICPPVPAADFGVVFSKRPFEEKAGRGLRIAAFQRNTPLKAAGLLAGDQLLRIDGSLVPTRQHYHELVRSLWGGKKIKVDFLRNGEEMSVECLAGTLPDKEWLQGYHGLKLGRGQVLLDVIYGSPADRAGCQKGDAILKINGRPISSDREMMSLLSNSGAGATLSLTLQRGPNKKQISFPLNRPTESVWIAGKKSAGGGWGYLTSVKGGNTFTTADALRELLKAQKAMPVLAIPDEMMNRAFVMLSELRMKQPNSEVESYRYDAAGSFWRVKDIRADVGRLNSAELACLMFCDTHFEGKITLHKRNQEHLKKTLETFLEHRGILDLVKFPSGHGKLSIAPWFWMYAYRTTLEAADYLTIDDSLKEEVRKICLKAFFKHMEFYHEPSLGKKGWIMGGDTSKELHDSCQLLDGLATMTHLWGSTVRCPHPKLQPVMAAFTRSEYGKAHLALRKIQVDEDAMFSEQAKTIEAAINHRLQGRLREIREIHQENPFDGLHHLRNMIHHFEGHPDIPKITKLDREWTLSLPEIKPSSIDLVKTLGTFPGKRQSGEDDAQAWDRVLKLRASKPEAQQWKNATNLFQGVTPGTNSRKGKWATTRGQFLSPNDSNARLELASAPNGDYRLELQFTKLKGDCLAVMLPVGDTSCLLVVGGWGGKASGLAFIDGKDANKNSTTRGGQLSLATKHTLSIKVTLLPGGLAAIETKMNGSPYLKWKGKRSSLQPDRQWHLRKPGAIGVGAYGSRILFHSCQMQQL